MKTRRWIVILITLVGVLLGSREPYGARADVPAPALAVECQTIWRCTLTIRIPSFRPEASALPVPSLRDWVDVLIGLIADRRVRPLRGMR
jgi:hypothetical protein